MMPHDWPLVVQQPEIAKECDSDMAVMKFTVQKSNELFDVLYGNGIFYLLGKLWEVDQQLYLCVSLLCEWYCVV